MAPAVAVAVNVRWRSTGPELYHAGFSTRTGWFRNQRGQLTSLPTGMAGRARCPRPPRTGWKQSQPIPPLSEFVVCENVISWCNLVGLQTKIHCNHGSCGGQHRASQNKRKSQLCTVVQQGMFLKHDRSPQRELHPKRHLTWRACLEYGGSNGIIRLAPCLRQM